MSEYAHGIPCKWEPQGNSIQLGKFCTFSESSRHSLTCTRNFNLLSTLLIFRNSGYTYMLTGTSLWFQCLLYQHSIPESVWQGKKYHFLGSNMNCILLFPKILSFLSLFPYAQILITSFSQNKYLLLCFNYWFNLNFFPLDNCTTGWGAQQASVVFVLSEVLIQLLLVFNKSYYSVTNLSASLLNNFELKRN